MLCAYKRGKSRKQSWGLIERHFNIGLSIRVEIEVLKGRQDTPQKHGCEFFKEESQNRESLQGHGLQWCLPCTQKSNAHH